MKRFVYITWLITQCYCVFSQNNLITNIRARDVISLNGKWSYVLDPLSPSKVYEKLYLDTVVPDKTGRLEFNYNTSAERLFVPGDWNTQNEKLFFYEGTVWYRKKLDYQKKDDKRVFLYVGAANYKASIYIAGKKIGTHLGGFTPFNFEVTQYLKNGENSIIFQVDNTRLPDVIPPMRTDWWNYGGLTRDVFLVEVNNTFIQDYYIQLEKGSNKILDCWVQLNGDNLQMPVNINIPELKIHKTITPDENGFATIKIEPKQNISYWDCSNPKLYDVTLSLGDSEIKDKIGFRTIETKGGEILLNGNPVFLRGICIHEENPIKGGRANSLLDAKLLLGWAKELNCNFVRLAHYPHNEYMVRLADEMGLMVWSEIPAYSIISWENAETYQNAQNQLGEIITRDRNRASVIIWSMANETLISDQRNKFLNDLVDFTRQEDPLRLVSAALHLNKEASTRYNKIVDDPLGENLDIISVNQYNGWYYGLPSICDSISWDIRFDKPFVFSETGAGALHGFHGDSTTRWSEEYQESYYIETCEMLDRIPELRGISPWVLVDFRSPLRRLYIYQDFRNRKGLISDSGYKKKAFFILKKYYDKKEIQYK